MVIYNLVFTSTMKKLQLLSFIVVLVYRTHSSFNALNCLCFESEQSLPNRGRKDAPSSTAEAGRCVSADTGKCTTSVTL